MNEGIIKNHHDRIFICFWDKNVYIHIRYSIHTGGQNLPPPFHYGLLIIHFFFFMTLPHKTILDPHDVEQIVADPNVLSIMTRQQAEDFGICVFSRDGRKLYAITTNEFPIKVASFTATQSAS